LEFARPRKRADGFHEIDTDAANHQLYDTPHGPGNDDAQISLWCDDRQVPADERNLVWRAA
jgi:4-diphosphocytidyl-2C-methyl-D-erythritol kinase